MGDALLAVVAATARRQLDGPPLALLRDGAADQPDRLQSLQASISWTLDLLTPSAQAFFARLAVLAGGWTLEAAEAVAGDGDGGVQEELGSLIGLSLVWRTVQPDGTSQYGMLETIREFGIEQLVAQGEDTSVRDRHACGILALARGTRAGSSQLDQILAIGPLEPEHANIRAALRWLDATGQTEALADSVSALEHHWEWNAHVVEGLGWYQRALAAKRSISGLATGGAGRGCSPGPKDRQPARRGAGRGVRVAGGGVRNAASAPGCHLARGNVRRGLRRILPS